MPHVSHFDEIAAVYDETRGGEGRGDEYAADIDCVLPTGSGTVLEIGVGTGVVALGLRRRGRTVVGVDLSGPMLARAVTRLGASVARGDALRLPVRTASVRHAVAVWVIHDVADPDQLLKEAARVLQPGGKLVVSDIQIPQRDDPIGRVLGEMTDRLHAHHTSMRPRGLWGEEIVERATPHGFVGEVVRIEREWTSHPGYELDSIRNRAWSALRDLDDDEYDRVAGPAIAALEAMPDVETVQRAWSELAVLTRTLSDGVVALRPLAPQDAGVIASASADPAIRRYSMPHDRGGHPAPPLSITDAGAAIDRFTAKWQAFAAHEPPCGVAFAIVDAQTGTFVGMCGVDDWSAEDVAQIGYWLAPGARGHGYATRAVILLSRWLFELGAARVFLTIVAGNEASVAVARRAGFVHEGTMRSHGVWQDERCDVEWFAALPREWSFRAAQQQT